MMNWSRWLTGCVVFAAIGACSDDGAVTSASAGMSEGSTTGDTTTGTTTTGTEPTTTASPTTEGTLGETTTSGTTTPTTGVMTSATTLLPGVCGDGVIDDGEACDDGNDIDDDTCTDQCLLNSCGDGVLQLPAGEQCEGDDLGEHTCITLGFGGGALTCLDNCMHDTSACTTCGDGVLDLDEACDDGNTLPDDGCDPTCQLEACDPDGTYAIDGDPIAYTCCNGLVDLTIGAFIFTADGATIASSPASPVAMTGAVTMCPDGDFTNTGVLAGGCTETYSLAGEFIDPNTWVGTYSLGFDGADCSCFNGMFGAPCIGQNFPITAKR